MRVVTLILAAGLVTGCIRTSTDPVTGRVDVDVESPTKQGEEWKAAIAGTTIPSITGSATARVYAGETEVTVSLTGVPTGELRPWHIHEGTCGSGGPIVGSPTAYPPLTVGEDGKATGSARISLQLDEAKSYHVNVHASAAQMATIIACGALDD
ncbi:MAG TPA: hypothetical protein VGE02_17130 [Gemmatimonadales bacterium]